MNLLSDRMLNDFEKSVDFSPLEVLASISEEEIAFDSFSFYNSVSSVYSSRIEGETMELDSFIKHKFYNVEFEFDKTKRIDDLYNSYTFIKNHRLSYENHLQAHKILSQNLLPEIHRGRLRNSLMHVINERGTIEYVAPDSYKIKDELNKLFRDIDDLLDQDLNEIEVFYYASLIHLIYAKIHPLNDGNGRISRLLEKWFLKEKFGDIAFSIPLEKNYYMKLDDYYNNLKKLGFEYEETDISLGLDFLLMTIKSLKN